MGEGEISTRAGIGISTAGEEGIAFVSINMTYS